ncbi:hypothetical protein G7Y89_g13429 [Cudoniella acicularis]|uniref:Heterokaryon incompatibility domain-containing protein n=1 Tax=Cudoniella acicularis TaxID=354080 RepID=A0A8H4R6X4_9HELO|nr:hypothetical protein G7Y89_g13429 [Cudoniella acicularis]
MAVYNHTPISLQGPALRLVRLLRGTPSDSIRCDIFDAWLTESEGGIIPYQALSYTWGSTENAAEITIKDCKMRVTENLHSALLHLRLEDTDRILWIDAICINQENLQERAHQVKQMGDIYRKAEEVLIWLGQATDETDIAMDSMSQLHKEITQIGSNWRQFGQTWMIAQLSKRLTFPGVYADWRDVHSMQRDGLKVLLRRSWFQRIWVLQEVANARVALVVCGRKSISAGTFALVPSMLQLPLDKHCQAVLDIMPGISRNESWWSEKRDLYTLLEKFGGSQATDPRDRIFALLGMSTDACQSKILVRKKALLEAEKGHDAMVKLLLKWDNIEVNASDKKGLTALHLAVSSGSAATLRRLIQNGADLGAEDKHGERALHHAASGGYQDALRVFLEEKVDIMVKTRHGASSLHLAASNRHDQIVRLLLESGVDVNAVANHNSTALHWAASKGHESTVRLLLEKGADIETEISYDGKGPRSFTRKSLSQLIKNPEFAAGNDEEEVSEELRREHLQLVLGMGEEHHIHATEKCTALQVAAKEGHDEIVRLLKSGGRDTVPLQGRRILELGEEGDGDNSTRPTKKRFKIR